jgi:6,7-dimethyl-8-ribityllumazine synthase
MIKSEIKKLKIGVVVSEFNDHLTKKLLAACEKELSSLGVLKKNISIIWVPGAFEIPLIAKKMALKKSIDAVICLGVVVRGETLHFDMVANASALGIQQVALETLKPIIYEVLACDTMQLAEDRSKNNGYNKGTLGAKAAIDMLEATKKFDKR